MTAIEDFRNAPAGATATRDDGNRAMKRTDGGRRWALITGLHYGDEEMVYWGFTLDPIGPRPTSAREALDLAWELAHPVKEGQIIPNGTRYLMASGLGIKEYTASRDFKTTPEHVSATRTLKPLPEPEPDWLDAPAVMARVADWPSCHDPKVFTRENETGTQWVLDTKVYRWDELVGVTPLYPRGQEA